MRLREELPEFLGDLQWMNGRVTKNQLIGEVPVLIHFWSISCKLCKNSMEPINKWKSLYNGKFKIVSVHMPLIPEDVNNSLIYSSIHQMQMTHPVCLDHDLIVSNTYRNRFVPAFFLFDKEGQLRHYQSGEAGIQMLERRLIYLMNELKK